TSATTSPRDSRQDGQTAGAPDQHDSGNNDRRRRDGRRTNQHDSGDGRTAGAPKNSRQAHPIT
ncbi:hypothetical protein, partial [Actinoplanes rectilineatus]|uniref:hypothetical protein n=1 Tax=Actinoplanes rectilineatus TaxID=113571 RepID=UPI001B800762